MTEQNKLYLPHLLNGVLTKLSALFFQKLVLFDSEILEAKYLRHYDHQCEGLMSLIHFFQRKINKNQILAFQKIKNPKSGFYENDSFIPEDSFKDFTKRASFKIFQETATPKTKLLSRVNTTFQQSDNSFVFSPNVKKYGKITSRTQRMGSSVSQKSIILQKLLTRVKKVNHDASQQLLTPTKSSYFNLTLGKQSLQTFQNQCNCACHDESCKRDTKMMKRKKILQKFERIQQKIYEQESVYGDNYLTQKPVNRVRKTKGPKTTYSVYNQSMHESRPKEIIYVKSNYPKDHFYEVKSTVLSTSKSLANICYANQVYI